eukprot:TRINITY_DN30927_c0_g1_i1.p1 TRINITY_DN30927_c0_g1~~TRINITY_DN30927_c0_g1_i1.p1  ORF type:complete len:201 (-),score=35.07 TRINITY_DN30927_c0_g1_i1:217-819(-)
MMRRPPRSTHCISSAASDVYKRQLYKSSSTHNLMQNSTTFRLNWQTRLMSYIENLTLKYGQAKILIIQNAEFCMTMTLQTVLEKYYSQIEIVSSLENALEKLQNLISSEQNLQKMYSLMFINISKENIDNQAVLLGKIHHILSQNKVSGKCLRVACINNSLTEEEKEKLLIQGVHSLIQKQSTCIDIERCLYQLVTTAVI